MPAKLKTRVEQIRQARKIHGGTMKMCAAAVGVKLARMPIPSRRLRERVYRTVYGQKYTALNEQQLERPLAEFRSLNELFTRGVRSECRPICDEEDAILCPCDGTVQDFGMLTGDTLLTAKHIAYPLTALLPDVNVQHLENGRFAIFFLSPADCHRVFSPQQAELVELIHVPGRRLLVHPPFQKREFPVFSLNERVILRMKGASGEFVLVMVAGWGVGNITYPFPVDLKVSKRRITRWTLPQPKQLTRGEWVGTFELGSTVIMLLPPQDGLAANVQFDERVNYGQRAFSVSESTGEGI